MVARNLENENFFLSLIKDKKISLDEFGKVINKNTGNEIGNISVKGYKSIGWKVDGKVKHQLVHRLVHIIYNDGFTESQPLCNHKDGNKANNHFSNLERCSEKENNQHAFDNGLRKKPTDDQKEHLSIILSGQNGAGAKITDEQAVEIRNKYKTGLYTYRKLGNLYNVAHNTISDIVNKKSFSRV